MPFHDLNVIYDKNHENLANTLAFLRELDYDVAALTINVSSKLPAQLERLPFDKIQLPQSLHVLSRLTLTISDTSQNHRLNSLTAAYDLVALRPVNEKALQLCCGTLDCDLISLDASQRPQFPIKFKTVAAALQRGIRFEICYSSGITGSNDARRNIISNAASLIRATRGRGIILSSEAKTALGLRGPSDAINLAHVWGLSQERGKEAVCEEAGRVVRLASIKRSSYRGVVDIVDNGSKPAISTPTQEAKAADIDLNPPTASLKPATVMPTDLKRKASAKSLNEGRLPTNNSGEKLSKREMKRRAKKARLDRVTSTSTDTTQSKHKDKEASNGFAIRHESFNSKQPE